MVSPEANAPDVNLGFYTGSVGRLVDRAFGFGFVLGDVVAQGACGLSIYRPKGSRMTSLLVNCSGRSAFTYDGFRAHQHLSFQSQSLKLARHQSRPKAAGKGPPFRASSPADPPDKGQCDWRTVEFRF